MQTRPKPTTITIPEPIASVDGLYRTVAALKQAVEDIRGTRAKPKEPQPSATRMAKITVSPYQPETGEDGDFWFCNAQFGTGLSVYSSGFWQTVWP